MTPQPKAQRILAWSYSRLSTYIKCALLAKLKFIEKRQEPKNKFMEHGIEVHDKAEGYVKGRIKRLPKCLARFREEFKLLKTRLVEVELELAFDKDWKLVSWFAKDVYVRVKMDVVHTIDFLRDKTIFIIDYKTGKVREEQDKEQGELYAIGAFLKNPAAEWVQADFWYLDEGVITSETYTRSQLKKLQAKWKKKARPLLNDRIFAPKPGNHCRWCHFRKDNGGPCEY